VTKLRSESTKPFKQLSNDIRRISERMRPRPRHLSDTLAGSASDYEGAATPTPPQDSTALLPSASTPAVADRLSSTVGSDRPAPREHGAEPSPSAPALLDTTQATAALAGPLASPAAQSESGSDSDAASQASSAHSQPAAAPAAATAAAAPVDNSRVGCGCSDHLGDQMLNEVFPFTVDELVRLCFDTNGPVLRRVQQRRQMSGAPWGPTSGKAEIVQTRGCSTARCRLETTLGWACRHQRDGHGAACWAAQRLEAAHTNLQDAVPKPVGYAVAPVIAWALHRRC